MFFAAGLKILKNSQVIAMTKEVLKGKNILLGISGSIAAYKSAILARLLIKSGAEVKVVMTPSATSFISSLTLSTLTGQKVGIGIVDEQEWHNHVELGLWADVYLIAPCTANTLSELATGACDKLLTACYLSAKCPVIIAPAMDLDMWKHPATVRNIAQLTSDGVQLINVEYGDLASGLVGEGRMAEPENILKHLCHFFNARHRLAGKKVLITSGPTREAIDPVRFISNHSSGKMGTAIAEECLSEGAEVFFISGPAATYPAPHARLKVTHVVSAEEMLEESAKVYETCDISFFVAAVSDYRPKVTSSQKIKKSSDVMNIELVKNPDIARLLGAKKRDDQINVGFALETNHEIQYAVDKLNSKNFDFVVLNSMRDEGAGFGHDTNKVSLFFKDGLRRELQLDMKKNIAKEIINEVCALYTRS